jgi:cytidine deaminase
MNRSTLRIDYTETVKEKLDREDSELIDMAFQAAHNAYSPYSNFKVGAAVRLDSGMILQGNNQENASFPAGICAERAAGTPVRIILANEDKVFIFKSVKDLLPFGFDSF